MTNVETEASEADFRVESARLAFDACVEMKHCSLDTQKFLWKSTALFDKSLNR